MRKAERRLRMKHYICVEEHEITYVCGTYRKPGRDPGRGRIVVQDARSVSADADMKGVFMCLAKAHDLAGRKVNLVLGRDLSYMKVLLPKSGDRALRRMAGNELVAEGKCKADCLAAVDIQRGFGERHIPVMVYYMEKEKLDVYTDAMEQAGILHGSTFLVPDCAAAAAQILCKTRNSILIDVEKEGLGLYAVSSGHCLAWRSTPLKAGRFCERNARKLLYEEIAEQAEQIRRQVETDCGSFGPERIVLAGNCLSDMKEAIAFMEQHFKLPCTCTNFNVSVEPDAKALRRNMEMNVDPGSVSPGALAAIVAQSRRAPGILRLKAIRDGEGDGLFRGLSRIMSRGFALFLLANAAVAAGIFVYIQALSHQTYQDMVSLRGDMNATEYRERYQKIQNLDSRMVEEAARRNAAEIARKAASSYLRKEHFEAFTKAMEPDMQVGSVVYERGHASYLEMVISHNDPAQVPAYVEQVRSSGIFREVSHTLWEKREDVDGWRVYSSVRGVLEQGGQNEIQ